MGTVIKPIWSVDSCAMQAQQPSAALGQVLASTEHGAAAAGSTAAGPATEGTSGKGLPAAIALPSALALPALGLPEGLPVGSTPQNILALLQEHAGAPLILECLLAHALCSSVELPLRLCPTCPLRPVPLVADTGAFVLEVLKRASVEVECSSEWFGKQWVMWPLPRPCHQCSWCCLSRLNVYREYVFSKAHHAAMSSGGWCSGLQPTACHTTLQCFPSGLALA